MRSRLLPLLLLAIALPPCLAGTGAPSSSPPTVFLVDQQEEASWRDLAYLAAVPAACKVNGGNAPVIALDDSGTIPREVADYLRRLKPSGIVHVGTSPLTSVPGECKPRELQKKSAEAVAIALAADFWTSVPRVVLCRQDDYASALIASTLAARLRVPLLFCDDKGLSQQTSDAIRKLKAKERIFVGSTPGNLKTTELADLPAVLSWLKKQNLDTTYLALVNTRDRSATTVRKLSLLAPVLASAHDGMVVPLDREIQWREPFNGTPVKGDIPKGIATGKKPPKRGTIELSDGAVPFVLSFGPSGKDRILHLDLDGDGAFDGPGEGPLKKNGVVDLQGKPRALDFGRRHGSKCDLTVSTGSAEDVCRELRKLYELTGIPRYLCLVGFPDAIPQAILPRGNTDMTSDLPYGNADDDLFSEIAVGRIIGENLTFATLHASRIVTYDSLLDPMWSGKAGQARWENTMIHNFENAGLDASAFHDQQHLAWIEPPADGKKGKRARSFGQDSPLTHVAFLTHMAHSWWKDIGQTYDMDSNVLLAPVVVESGGCLTCTLDYEPGFRSVISRFFRNGAVSFVGQTRPGIAHQEQQRAQFWNSVLAGTTLGDAHRNAQNSMTVTVLETNQTNGGPDHYQLHIRSLFGDPAFRPHLPSKLRSTPARIEVTDNLVSVHAPETWWPVKMRVPEDWKKWADKPLYVLRGAGTYPHRYWCREQYDREETFANAELTTRRTVKSITQVQSPAQPLGWTGKHTVDHNLDGSRTYRWRVRLADFDQQTGKIIRKLDRFDYRIEFEG